MPNTMKPDSTFTARADSTHSQAGGHEPAVDQPGTHADDSTVKNPKTPETSGDTRAGRVANKAAHKAARDEQDFDKNNTIVSH